MTTDDSTTLTLPRPGLLGIIIRLALGLAVLFMAYGAIRDATSFWDGYSDPASSLGYIIPLTIFSSWVITELTRKQWGWKPAVALLLGLAAATIIGALQGTPFGPIYGIYVWIWVLLFSLLLGPALLLAAILRTPGCEMRSYAHLVATMRGADATSTVCPGWIDRADKIRLFGRW